MSEIIGTYTHKEIRAHGSNDQFSVKNKTLQSGQALMESGTVMGEVTATRLLVPWTAAATNGVGSDTPVGILKSNASTDDPVRVEPTGVYVRGNFQYAKLLDGADNAWIAAMGGRLDAVEGVVYI